MKKALKWVLRGLGALLALLFLGFIVIEIRGIPRYPTERVELKVEVTPERVARGKRWVTMLCAECHGDPTTHALTGRALLEMPAEFGLVYSKNITRHPEKGIGRWTDGEIAYLLRTGLRKDGQYVPPPMPKLEGLADDDLEAIVAFLRSDDDIVAAADVDDKESEPSFLAKLLCNVAFKPKAYPKARIPAPSSGDVLETGKYLVRNLQCYGCHSRDFRTNRLPMETSDGFLGGGNRLQDWSGKAIYSPNITMDEATGIGKWNDTAFRRAIHDGFRPDDSPILYPMPKLPELSDDEVNAIYAYLKSVPKLENRRPPAEAEPPSGLTGGKAIYYKYRCDSCHGDAGIGACDLRDATQKFPTAELLTAFLQDPRSVVPNSHMPPWKGVIKDDEFAPLAEYVGSLGKK
jgi:mono/diheme cytochrome c family protein